MASAKKNVKPPATIVAPRRGESSQTRTAGKPATKAAKETIETRSKKGAQAAPRSDGSGRGGKTQTGKAIASLSAKGGRKSGGSQTVAKTRTGVGGTKSRVRSQPVQAAAQEVAKGSVKNKTSLGPAQKAAAKSGSGRIEGGASETSVRAGGVKKVSPASSDGSAAKTRGVARVAPAQKKSPGKAPAERRGTARATSGDGNKIAALATAADAVAVSSLTAKRKSTLNPAAISRTAADTLTSTSGSGLHDRTTVTKKIEKKKSAGTAASSVEPAVETVVLGSARPKTSFRQAAHVESLVNPPKDAMKMRAAVLSPAEAAAVVSAVPNSAEPAIEPAPVEKPIVPVRPAKAPNSARQGFKPLEYIVYPAHGVGQIVAIEEQEVAGFKLELFVIIFVKDKMILKVPVPKVASVGMRKLAEADVVKKALNTLAGRARIKRTMWSRRAQEYEAKINSGDLVAISEVVRDLYRSDSQPEQSYSERQLYEAALDRMAREVVVVHKLTETESLKLIEAQLQKGPRRGKAEDIEADDAIEEAA